MFAKTVAPPLDHTHDPRLQSWVTSANGHSEFPIQNLPFGVFSAPDRGSAIGVAIGNQILDLAAAVESEALTDLSGDLRAALTASDLAPLMRLGARPRQALRGAISALLSEAQGISRADDLLVAAQSATLHLPCAVGGFSDFFAGIHHARNAARSMGIPGGLWTNYRHLPIAYNGRASTVRPSGTQVARPSGQRRLPGDAEPSFGPCAMMDYELEMCAWIGKPTTFGAPVSVADAWDHIFGFSLLNDWSARDFQMWENQPLGPFLSKSVLTTVSPWIVTPEALAPFRAPLSLQAQDDVARFPYLSDAGDQAWGGFAISVEAAIRTRRMRDAEAPSERLSLSNSTDLYWSFAQMIAHHTSNGCDLRTGDLIGTGTISGPDREGYASLIELTDGGTRPVTLANGEVRGFLEDGDEVILTGHCHGPDHVSIGFGANTGIVG